MECQACGSENREGRRFCSECGASLASPCPQCAFVNEPGEKFCGGCGVSLAPASAPGASKPETAQTPTPSPRVDRKHEETEATRRQLTVMFCDLVGSTALSERLDPEDLSELLEAYQDTCAAAINRFDGYIGRYVGDALLVYFSYPQAHEDDPQRAVRAGLGIVEAIGALNPKLGKPGITLAVRIGISTGLVVVGDIGKGERREKSAIVGETPNLAARLQDFAEPNTIVIGAATHRLVEDLFICDDLGPQQLKGISEPVAAYRVREESGVRDRFEATVRRGLTPLVGREEEINLLLRRWEQANDSEGQVVLLSGESGLGKSRTLRNFQERVQSEPCNRVLYYCSPYHRDTPFYPVIDQLQRGLRFEKSDSVAQKLDRLDSVLSNLGLPGADLAPLFASLLSLPTAERYPPLALSPEDTKKKTLQACVTIIDAMASQQPVLMIVEDLHWIDPSTLELLNLLVEHSQSARLLLINTFRPDFEPPWSDQPHISLIKLKRLSRKESETLITKVAKGKGLPAEVLDQIMGRTDGVPLFVEELTKTVLESDLLKDAGDRFVLSGPLQPLAIPASLQDSLMARLDRLAPVKEVAQLAATLGRTFSYELLAAVAQRAESALEDALSQLIDAELLYRRGLSAELTYEFKHAMVQDVAYNSLLRSKRQQLHKEIVAILEKQFPDTVNTKPELLAHHYREAALPERAIPYALQAGDAAAARYARTEATAHYQAALDMARSLPPSENASESQIRAILKLANVASNRQQFERDLKNLEYARSLAEKINDKHLLYQILYWIGRTNYVLGQFDLGVEYAEKSLQIAEALGGEDQVTADPVNLLARIHCLRGEPREASKYAARNVEQMHKVGNQIEEAAIAGVLAFAYGLHGRFSQAVEAAHRGVEVAQKTEHLPTIAACFMFRAVAHGWHGDLEAAVPDFEQAIAVCVKSGDLFRKYLTHGWRGEAYLLADGVESAETDLTECLALGDQIGTSFHRGAFQAFLAKVRLQQGDVKRALRLSEEAVKIATDTVQTWSRSIALRIRAEALLAADPPQLTAAEEAVRDAIEIQERRECRCDLAWSQLVLGYVLAAKGEPEDAKKAFDTAAQMFEGAGIAQGRDKTAAARDVLGQTRKSGAAVH